MMVHGVGLLGRTVDLGLKNPRRNCGARPPGGEIERGQAFVHHRVECREVNLFNIQTSGWEVLNRKNLKRKIILAAGAIACLAVCVWATEPWKNADFEKWSAKDVDRILNNSPWAKQITIPYSPYLNGDSPETDQQMKIGKAGDPGGADAQTYHASGTFTLRWNSALTLRRALYREAVLKGMGTDDASQRYLINDEENVDLVLIPTGQTLLPPTEAISLRRETYLELKPSGRKIYAVIAETRMWVDARDSRGYFFAFPQRMKDGAPSIPKDATEISFFTQVGVRKFEAKFKVAEMMMGEGADYF
jgi:hypothetical protein